jgi:hypothetical protein
MKNLLALSAVALLVAGPSLADSAFSLDRVQDQGNLVELSNVRAEGAGVVEIYDFSRGEVGRLLGSAPVNAGANAEVRIALQGNPLNDALAVIRVDGNVVAEQALRFED